jgi:uncharacterized membrane protein YgdD (TMEM256/DUF423 family)
MAGGWIVAAAGVGALGVILGAFGAHGLEARVGADSLRTWETAVRYHLLHAVALLALALHGAAAQRGISLPAGLWTGGIVLFSGSLYLLTLGGPRWLGPVTPLGGLFLIAGWLSLWTLRR